MLQHETCQSMKRYYRKQLTPPIRYKIEITAYKKRSARKWNYPAKKENKSTRSSTNSVKPMCCEQQFCRNQRDKNEATAFDARPRKVDECLNDAENVDTEEQDSGSNEYVGTSGDANEQVSISHWEFYVSNSTFFKHFLSLSIARSLPQFVSFTKVSAARPGQLASKQKGIQIADDRPTNDYRNDDDGISTSFRQF